MPDVNKVVFGSETLIDLTSDTVAAATLAEGETAHDASGAAITGEAQLRTWDAVAFIAGNGSTRSTGSFTALNRLLWGADPVYFDDPVRVGGDDAISLICKKAGYYVGSIHARGSNNANANFRVTVNGTTEVTISGAPNAGSTGSFTQTLAVGDVISFTARNASNSTSAYSLCAYFYYPEGQ